MAHGPELELELPQSLPRMVTGTKGWGPQHVLDKDRASPGTWNRADFHGNEGSFSALKVMLAENKRLLLDEQLMVSATLWTHSTHNWRQLCLQSFGLLGNSFFDNQCVCVFTHELRPSVHPGGPSLLSLAHFPVLRL